MDEKCYKQIMTTDTIYALATPSGMAGVAVVRVSGPLALSIAQQMTRRTRSFRPRYAHYVSFYSSIPSDSTPMSHRVDAKKKAHKVAAAGGENQDPTLIDQGLLLYFPAPHSFTGESVVEMHCHGSMVVVKKLGGVMQTLGAREAEPGEFSERAYRNGKQSLFDLEMVCDLIHSKTEAAHCAAIQSLQGGFERVLQPIYEGMVAFRVQVEAAIDFVEEEADFITQNHINPKLQGLHQKIEDLIPQVEQGVVYNEGVSVMILGPENVGKSTLHNALSQQDKCIVTDIPGTTRQMHDQWVHIAGVPCELIDTPGLRRSEDRVEQVGIAQVQQAVHRAQVVVFVLDVTRHDVSMVDQIWSDYFGDTPQPKKKIVVMNKIDRLNLKEKSRWVSLEKQQAHLVCISLLERQRVDVLQRQLQRVILGQGALKSPFLARARHVDALSLAQKALGEAMQHMVSGTYELVAEELKVAIESLELILGRSGRDQLLTQIFRTFCLGK